MSSTIVHILIFPFPAQGHMIPLLDFADELSYHKNLTVTIFVTPANLPLLQPLLSRSPAIQTLVLPFPSHPPIPPGVENLKDLPPGYFFPMMYALGFLHNPLLDWARKASNPPDVIVSDFFLGWTNRLAAEIGIPRVVFSPSGAFTLSTIHNLWKEMPKKDADVPDSDYTRRFSNIPGSPEFPWSQISSVFRRYVKGDVDSEFIRGGFIGNSESWGQVINTFEDLEGRYLEHLRKELSPNDRVWAVGPLGTGTKSTIAKDRGGTSAVSIDSLVSWLDSCPDRSVVYICFGSQAVLNQPQTEVVMTAMGLSGSRFVWVGTGGTIPTSFDEEMVGRGMVIRGWAPQVAILNHPAVGSFLTHCGWNSMLEAVSAGVISLTWPLRADQFIDARLLLELGIGVRACEGGEDGVPDAKELGRVISESTSGMLTDVEEKVLELKRRALDSVAPGGSSSQSMKQFVEDLLGMVKTKKGIIF